MKKIILIAAILVIAVSAFSQSPDRPSPAANNHWLTTSKSQQKTAWILLASGAAIAATGGIIQLNHESSREGLDFDFTGATIAIVGGAVCLTSIPFFIASSKSQKKGISLSFSGETTRQIRQKEFVYYFIPSLKLKIAL